MCMNFMEHQSIDLVFNIVSNVLSVFPGRSVKNSLHAMPAHGRKMMCLFFFVSVFVLLSFSLSRGYSLTCTLMSLS